MCGIAGIFNYSRRESPKLDSIIQMTNETNNRGPDDEGYFLDSGHPNAVFNMDMMGRLLRYITSKNQLTAGQKEQRDYIKKLRNKIA